MGEQEKVQTLQEWKSDLARDLNIAKIEVLRLERLNGDKCMVELALRDKEKELEGEMQSMAADITRLKVEKDGNKCMNEQVEVLEGETTRLQAQVNQLDKQNKVLLLQMEKS